MLIKSNLILNNSKYLAAVSGGPDSMALLDLYQKQIAVVCHINYHKRKDSKNDENIVKQYCISHKIKLEILNVDEKHYQLYKINNFQNLARKIRYDFFRKIAKKYSLSTILVAHNLNDFLETAYMQKIKKSLNLFYGIKTVSQYKDLKIIRPLIYFPKNLLLEYCVKHQIPYAIDYTNDQEIYERNKVRKIISGWKKTELNKFLKWIVEHNEKNKKIDSLTNSMYVTWKKNKFNLDFFFEKSSLIQRQLIYLLLIDFDFKSRSENKIKTINSFLKSKLNFKTLRVAKNYYLKKNCNRLEILFFQDNKSL